MRVIVRVTEKIISEAHINIPDGLSESGIKQHIVDRYNSGQMLTEMNIYQVEFESISAKIISNQNNVELTVLNQIKCNREAV